MNPIYTTKRLQYLIERVDTPSSFLRDRYFPCNEASDIFGTEQVLIETRDAEGRVAPFTSSLGAGVPVSRKGQSMTAYTPPSVAPMRPLTLLDLKKRGFGEALYTELPEEERALLIATRDMQELDDMITRREELMAAEVMLENGCKVYPIGDDVELTETDEIRFYDDSNKSNPARMAITTDWDDPAADILGDLYSMMTELVKYGLPATDFVCSPDVADAMTNNETIQQLLDNRRYELGEVAPKLADPAASIIAMLNVHGHMINIISYEKLYTGDDGKSHLYIPSGMGIMTAPAAGHTLYGAVTQMEQDLEFHTYFGRRVPKVEGDVHGNVRSLVLTARPLLVPGSVNPFISAKLLSN